MKKYLLVGLVVLTSFFLYSYHLSESFFYNPDFARDLYDISRITQGKLTLIGPKLTFGGIYSGPYYYYLFAPILFISRLNISAFLLFNAFLFSIALGYFFKKTYEKYSLWVSATATLAFGILPLWITAARNPSNAFTYLPILLMMLTYLYYNQVQKKIELFLLGFLCGVLATFHLVTMTLIPLLFLYVFIFLRNKKDIVFSILGGVVAFSPLIIFEVKHNFVMFTNTFIHKSYLRWVNNTNIPGGLEGKKNIFENIFFLTSQTRYFTVIHPGIFLLVMGFLAYFKKVAKKEQALLMCAVFSLLLFAGIIRFQFIPHYLFPTLFFIFFVFIIYLLKAKFHFLFIVLIFIFFQAFPHHLYTNSQRTEEQFEKATDYVIANNIISQNEKFNIIQITKLDLLAILAFEYRFFFNKLGYRPLSEFQYNDADVLLIFSEKPDMDMTKFTSWEIEQFGKEYLKNATKYKNDNLIIYKVSKF